MRPYMDNEPGSLLRGVINGAPLGILLWAALAGAIWSFPF